jgi:non-heme chloroperoxidase
MSDPITATERTQISAANASGKPTVVFVHGLWLLASSWDPWRDYFEAKGFATIAPSWPDDPATVEEARRDPSVLAGKGVAQVTNHMADVIGELTTQPVIIGHSFGGLITQKLAGMGLASSSVVIDPAPFKGVLPLPASTLKSSLPVLGNPANKKKAIALTFKQFRYGWANALTEEEAKELHDTFHIAAPGKPLFQAALANYTPHSEASVDTRAVNRGPMKLLSGGADHTVPWAITNASYKKQRHNVAVTEIEEVPDRGHSLTIDSGWELVADLAHDFVSKHATDLSTP